MNYLKILIAKVVTLVKLELEKDWAPTLSWITFVTIISIWVWIHLQTF